jgi:hypothetical protein
MPTLPGRAGREEIARFLKSFTGMLTDARGKPLVAPDGTPLRLGELLWLSTAGGAFSALLETEDRPAHISPMLLYGFDAIYSVIGIDGRALTPNHFVAVQVEINSSDLAWVYGQQPLSEGWMRALIERLKDSYWPEHNILGEMLEEALTAGRFHTVLLRGLVEAGQPVSTSFHVARERAQASISDLPFIPGFAVS